MKTTVVSYSLTGNTKALATALAVELSSTHINITEPKPIRDDTSSYRLTQDDVTQLSAKAVESLRAVVSLSRCGFFGRINTKHGKY